MNLPILFFYPLFVLLSCGTSRTHTSDRPEEHLQIRRTSYSIANNEATEYLAMIDNVWYQDSVGITQLSGIKSMQVESKTILSSILLGYRFVDMRRKWVYEYKTLSDTATIIKKQGNADSVELAGGWNFFRKAAIQFDSLRVIGDTSIDGVQYQRHRYAQHFAGKTLRSEILSRCDRKGTIFHLDVGVSNAIGCPMVKGTSLTPDGRLPTQSVEIEFISNIFPDSVRRVLAAWKRNVELYPVE
jgi:hypothetical protein